MRYSYNKVIIAVAVCALAAAACASRPTKAIKAAEQAILDARKVKAHECAPKPYEKAENLLLTAREDEKKRDYDSAAAHAVAARKMADLSIEAAVKNKDCRPGGSAGRVLDRMRQRVAESEEQKPAETEQTPTPQDKTAVLESIPEEYARSVLPGGEILKMIHFDFDSDKLTLGAIEILKKNAALLRKYPEVKITIEGHCDSRGSTEYNLALGYRRAERAKDFLIHLGIDPSRLNTVSYGEERPLDPRENEEAWAKNRRDEFVVE